MKESSAMKFTHNTLPEGVSLNHELLIRIVQILLNPGMPETDTWFNIDQLCEYHPSKPAKATVYTWVRKKKIPYHKSGKKLVFLKSEVDDYIKKSRQKTISEIEEEADNNLSKQKRRGSEHHDGI